MNQLQIMEEYIAQWTHLYLLASLKGLKSGCWVIRSKIMKSLGNRPLKGTSLIIMWNIKIILTDCGSVLSWRRSTLKWVSSLHAARFNFWLKCSRFLRHLHTFKWSLEILSKNYTSKLTHKSTWNYFSKKMCGLPLTIPFQPLKIYRWVLKTMRNEA